MEVYDIANVKVHLRTRRGNVNTCIYIWSDPGVKVHVYIYTCKCLPFNDLLSSNCIHKPKKTFAHVTNVV